MDPMIFAIVLAAILGLSLFLISTFITFIFLDYRIYPMKLRIIWWLMFLGLRIEGMSAKAHTIYNSWVQTLEEKANG